MDAMQDIASGGQAVDLGEWVHWYAFDVIGNITFSQSFKFMDNRADSGKILDSIEQNDRYSTIIGQVPGLHGWSLGNETVLKLLMMIPSVRDSHHIPKMLKVSCISQMLDNRLRDVLMVET